MLRNQNKIIRDVSNAYDAESVDGVGVADDVDVADDADNAEDIDNADYADDANDREGNRGMFTNVNKCLQMFGCIE